MSIGCGNIAGNNGTGGSVKGGSLSSYTEPSEALILDGGGNGTFDCTTALNGQIIDANQNFAVTATNPREGFAVTFKIKHNGAARSGTFNGTPLLLSGTNGKIEYITLEYLNGIWNGFEVNGLVMGDY